MVSNASSGGYQCVSDDQERLWAAQGEQARLQKEAADVQVAKQYADAQAAKQAAAADRRQQVIDEATRMEREGGYELTTVNDFKLDGKTLAETGAKVAIHGVYVKRGNIEFLFPSLMSSLIARETGSDDTAVPIITENASRSTRQYILNCQNNYYATQAGCGLNITGHASICTLTSLVGTTDEPCVIVEHSWFADRAQDVPGGG